jgi:hypothetical protein
MDALQPDRHADLDWIAGVLSQPPMVATVTRGGPGHPNADAWTFGVLPSAARPRLLVPLGSKRAAVASLRGATHAREPHVRLGRVVLRMALRLGLAQHVLRDRLSFDLGKTGTVAPELADVLLSEHLAEVFGRRDLSLAVRVGRVRPNRKPLIQVLSTAGAAVSYVKVGWNPLTRRLVTREADVLQKLGSERHSTFEVPRVLYRGSWHGFELLALSPLVGRIARPKETHLRDVSRAMIEISRLTDVEQRPLAESPYWYRTRERVGGLAVSSALTGLADQVEECFGAQVLAFGSWHGDWTPWNMARREGTLAVWDWERSADGVPVGLDGAHFDFQVALTQARRRWEKALPRVLAGDRALLPRFPDAGDRRALLTLHLLEMALRAAEGHEAGITSDDKIYIPALSALLQQS